METQTFVFFGQVGSGKGTQVKLLMSYLKDKDNKESLYAGTGEGFRKLLTYDNYTAHIVKQSMGKGELQPDFLTTTLFTNILTHSLDMNKHLFVDGYPRNISQAESFETIMEFYKRNLVKIIYIDVGKEEAIKRMKIRGRDDDNDQGISKRFDVYEKDVIPAMNYFKDKAGYEIYTIKGEQTVEEVHAEIINKLEMN